MAAADNITGAYIFQGANLVLPDDADIGPADLCPVDTAHAFHALSRSLAITTFGDPCEIPTVDGDAGMAAFMLDNDTVLPKGWRSVPIRQALSAVAGGMVTAGSPEGLLFRAYHIMQWRRESAYCGSCGSPNGDAPTGIARLCPVCGRQEFPRISPAVIVLVTNENGEALLAHNTNFADGIYSLIAGFVEAGENLESTIIREIREEVNIEVDSIQYAASQPWPFPNSLMLGFTAVYAGGTLKPDGTEILDAQWFKRDALPNLPGNGSVARHIIDRWYNRKTIEEE
ncbi:NADH pyrophosphatase [Spirochaetia bacterium]|nr:NADH pyrophosphatase [Spirochaetia bacterium]